MWRVVYQPDVGTGDVRPLLVVVDRLELFSDALILEVNDDLLVHRADAHGIAASGHSLRHLPSVGPDERIHVSEQLADEIVGNRAAEIGTQGGHGPVAATLGPGIGERDLALEFWIDDVFEAFDLACARLAGVDPDGA